MVTNDQQTPIKRATWTRFSRAVRNFAFSEVGRKAQGLFALLCALLLGINGLNVVNSYVARDFMTAIESRNMTAFIWQAGVYIAVFAASTVFAVFCRFSEDRLALLWREWLTRRLVSFYIEGRAYYRLDTANPDQRIADDVRAFTTSTLSFVLMLLNGTITVLAFAGVLWSISPMLFVVAVLYAATGSFVTIYFGRPLVRLNYDQSDQEANLRSALVHVRENAESVALLRREGRLMSRIMHHVDGLTDNFRRIIAVNRNLSFFTTGYNYLIQIIPALIVAPLFIRGNVEFGVIPQAAMAFTQLLGAFSLIVTNFQSISSFAAVTARLGALAESLEQTQLPTASPIEFSEEDGCLAYDGVTLRSHGNDHVLVKELRVTVPPGTRVLVAGPNDDAKVALFRATAGIWDSGEGRIIRPQLDRILFLPERPYLAPGTLRESLLRSGQERAVTDERILPTLRALDLDPVLARAGGLDVEQNWDDLLSLGEQQLIACARLLLAAPQFVFLDRPGTALGQQQVDRVLSMLSEKSITYLTLAGANDRVDHYDAILEIDGEGGWTWKPIRDAP
jgi:vitamin B12/bleomycin/antimicrobial peptide transport system ATP-binding/permease protein